MLLVNAKVDESGKLLRLETDGKEVLFVVTKPNGELTMVESETHVNMQTVYDKVEALVAPKPEGE